MLQPNCTRRQFLTSAVSATLMARAAHAFPVFRESSAAPCQVSLRPEVCLAQVPSSFIGLSYESSQLMHPGFFSAKNADLVRLFRTLSPNGVLRIGGNTSEFSRWSSTESPSGVVEYAVAGPDKNNGAAKPFALTPRSMDELAGFLDATGWRLVYGLNLAGGSAETAVDEARYVVKVCGHRLDAFQLGNEPEMFHHGADPRDRWTFEEYVGRWKAYAQGLQSALGRVPLAGPDVAYKTEWVGRFLDATEGRPAFASAHFYPEGPPTDPAATASGLLLDWRKFSEQVIGAKQLAEARGVPFRMTEGNSCYNGGKQGVSDTFASSLWAAEFVLRAASAGCQGVNLHGGGRGFYTPILSAADRSSEARPEFYGLMFGGVCAGSAMIACALTNGGDGMTAHAMREDGVTRVALINASPLQREVHVARPSKVAMTVTVRRLSGPSLEAESGVTYAGSAVSRAGTWMKKGQEDIAVSEAGFSVQMSAYSAAMVELA